MMSSQRIQWLHRSLPTSTRATMATNICATSVEKLRSCQFRCSTEVIDEALATDKEQLELYSEWDADESIDSDADDDNDDSDADADDDNDDADADESGDLDESRDLDKQLDEVMEGMKRLCESQNVAEDAIISSLFDSINQDQDQNQVLEVLDREEFNTRLNEVASQLFGVEEIDTIANAEEKKKARGKTTRKELLPQRVRELIDKGRHEYTETSKLQRKRTREVKRRVLTKVVQMRRNSDSKRRRSIRKSKTSNDDDEFVESEDDDEDGIWIPMDVLTR